MVGSVREVGTGARFSESSVISQKVTTEGAPGATISIGPVPWVPPSSQFRCVMRQLLFPVSMMSQWWVTRSSSAVVIFLMNNSKRSASLKHKRNAKQPTSKGQPCPRALMTPVSITRSIATSSVAPVTSPMSTPTCKSRPRQSFGLPVGGAAARLLAELALSDTDKALMDQGISATRFVDDFRIFLNAGENPYDVLSFLAQQLSINEGLALNAAKTRVFSQADFLKYIKGFTSDIGDEAGGAVLESLTADIYFDDEPAIEDIEALKALNLLSIQPE